MQKIFQGLNSKAKGKPAPKRPYTYFITFFKFYQAPFKRITQFNGKRNFV